jgi:stress response protein YsnF
MRKSNIIKPAILACSAGLLLTACHTERQEHHHRGYSDTSSSSSDNSWMRGSGAQSDYGVQSSSAASQNYSSGSQNYSASSSQQDQSTSAADQNNIVIPLHEEQVSVGKRTVDAGQVTLRKIVTTETVNEPVQLRRETLVIDREGAGAEARSTASGTQHDANWQKGSANLKESASASATQENEQNSSAQASAYQSSAEEPAGANSQSARSSSANSDLSSASGTAFQEQTYTIHLQKEEPVIQKNVVQTGQVVARKNSQTQQQTIQQQIRKEDVQLDKSGAAQNVEIRGNFNTAGKNISEPSGAERHESIENNQPAETQPSESIQNDSSGAQRLDTGVNESTDSTTQNRAPTKGQGAQDLKKQPEQSEP